MQTLSFDGTRWCEGEQNGAEYLWFNIERPDSEALEILRERFGLHALSIEDCLSPNPHAPKIDEFSDHLFLVLLAPREGRPGLTEEFDVFLGERFVITYADAPLPEVAKVMESTTDGRTLRRGPDGLVYEIVDIMVDGFLPATMALSDELEALGAAVLGESGRGPSREILELRTRAGKLRRHLVPQLGVIQRLSRGEFAFVQQANLIYFRDIFDHLVRLDFALEGVREDAEMALSTYLSNLNNRMNEVMKVLAVVAALALPATVITGVFGTNFDNVPGLHSNWGFALMIGAMAGLSGAMAWYFHQRKWW